MKETLVRTFSTHRLAQAVQLLRSRGLEFVHTSGVQVTHKGAITRSAMQSVVFELVHNQAP
jgi:4-hydroxyphenylpyruvate dioxygenase